MNASAASRAPRLVVLALGPLLTLALLGGASGDIGIAGLSMLAMLAWSPLPIGIPALLLQRERDAALAHYDGVAGSIVRGALLVPHLLAQSGVRLEMAISLITWTVVCIVAWPSASPMLSSLSL